ncbi:MAG: AAA family ATPase [Bacteroidales bacterium]|nr:AAA family ATPase [Bacteroidales bacterium]
MKGNDKKEYKDWYKTLKRIQKKELILFGALILLAFIFVGISEKAYEWFKIIKIYSVLDDNPLINIPICIIISGFAIWWWTKIWKDKDIRPYRLGIIAFGLIVFIFIDGFLYANIACNFSYQWFFIGLFSLLFIVFLIKILATCEIKWAQNLIEWKFKIFKKLIVRIEIFWKNKGKIKDKKNDNKPELKGFSVDNTEIKLEDSQIKYAETLVKKLKNTDLSKESFAVGITGEWGSGKSTFLNTMKEKIKEAKFAEIVEFNPWLCNSPEQVTQDFFATLIDKLSPKHSTLSRTINKYAKLLNKIAKPSLSIFGIDLDLTPGDDSLDELKENISKKLANLPKKVVILIDDTDRLEGNEVFEILRLIRNTADFKNVIYIATYDKEYVTDVLKENKIKEPNNYLEKIFQVEAHLLKVEDYELWDTLMKDLKEQLNFQSDNLITILKSYLKQYSDFIITILTNYRQVKRFARQFAVYLNYLKESKLINELSPIDLFWVELLQVYDNRVYNILAKDPFNFLQIGKDGLTINRVIIDEKDKRKEKSKWKEKTENILEIIFEKNYQDQKLPVYSNDIDSKRLRLGDNYFKYFALRVTPNKISFEEMKEMLNSVNPENELDNWLQDNKDYNSIIFQFFNHKINFNLGKYLDNYIVGLLYFASYSNYPDISNIRYLLQKGRYNDMVGKASEIANTWFKNKINNLDDTTELQRLSSLLNKLHERTTEEGDYEMIISYKEIEEHLQTIITKVLDSNKNYSALGILLPRFELNVMFKNCCVQSFDENGNEYYKQIALKIVIDHFSEKANKPTFEKFDEVYKENYEYDNMTDDDKTIIDTELTRLFGDNYEKNLKTFKEQCFT